MKRRKTKAVVPRALGGDRAAKQNRAAGLQARKVLGRHYAAKYRVQRRKG